MNRPAQFCRDLTESFDWCVLFDIHTDQLLVLDLSIGWYDIKRISFYVHQDSLHQGMKNYEKLRDGILLKGIVFFFSEKLMLFLDFFLEKKIKKHKN